MYFYRIRLKGGPWVANRDSTYAVEGDKFVAHLKKRYPHTKIDLTAHWWTNVEENAKVWTTHSKIRSYLSYCRALKEDTFNLFEVVDQDGNVESLTNIAQGS